MTPDTRPVTEAVGQMVRGDAAAAARLLPLVYDDLRALAHRRLGQERPGHPLTPTALVHEVFLRLVDQSRVDWQGRTHFFAIGAQAMRRILVDHARSRSAMKRGGDVASGIAGGDGPRRVPLDELIDDANRQGVDILALHEALLALAMVSERAARVVEFRYFGGLSVDECALFLSVSPRTVEGDFQFARAWLRRRLTSEPGS